MKYINKIIINIIKLKMKSIIKWIKKELIIKKIWSIYNKAKKQSEKNTNTVVWIKINLSKSHTKNRKKIK